MSAVRATQGDRRVGGPGVEREPASLTLDHVFVCCAAGAPEGDALVRRGLREGSRTTHPGQGTANRRFFFADVYVELLWVDDPRAAQSHRTRRTRLWDRWSQRGGDASPFGFLLRRTDASVPLPFATWDYLPAYLPDGLAIAFAERVPLAEPAIAVLPRLPGTGADRHAGEPTEHAAGFGELRHVGVQGPARTTLSSASRWLRDVAGIAYRVGPGHVLELDFAAARDVVHDLRPDLPLVLRGLARQPLPP